jgi:hypothetical protein
LSAPAHGHQQSKWRVGWSCIRKGAPGNGGETRAGESGSAAFRSRRHVLDRDVRLRMHLVQADVLVVAMMPNSVHLNDIFVISGDDGPPMKIDGNEVAARECSQASGVQISRLRCRIAEPAIRRDA